MNILATKWCITEHNLRITELNPRQNIITLLGINIRPPAHLKNNTTNQSSEHSKWAKESQKSSHPSKAPI